MAEGLLVRELLERDGPHAREAAAYLAGFVCEVCERITMRARLLLMFPDAWICAACHSRIVAEMPKT